MSLALRLWHFRVAEISFYILGFETQLMKIYSHSKLNAIPTAYDTNLRDQNVA